MKVGVIWIYLGTIMVGILIIVSIHTFIGMFNVAPTTSLYCNKWCHLENCGDDDKCIAIWGEQCKTKCGDDIINHDNFTHSPHYVKIHIMPEKEGIKVTAISEGQDIVLSGLTDSNSDVVFEMIPVLKYNLIVGFDFPPCQHYIIPRESEYLVRC